MWRPAISAVIHIHIHIHFQILKFFVVILSLVQIVNIRFYYIGPKCIWNPDRKLIIGNVFKEKKEKEKKEKGGKISKWVQTK